MSFSYTFKRGCRISLFFFDSNGVFGSFLVKERKGRERKGREKKRREEKGKRP